MVLAKWFYERAYIAGRPRWDNGTPVPELLAIQPRGTRSALDLGCGTGTNAIALASRGWRVTGVDFSPSAIAAARAKAEAAGVPVRFLVGDVTRLEQIGVRGPFDLVVDVSCYHGLSAQDQRRYAAGARSVTSEGAAVLLFGVERVPLAWRLIGAAGIDVVRLQHDFGSTFRVERSGTNFFSLRS